MENWLNFNLTAFSIFEKYFRVHQRQGHYVLWSERTIDFLINANNSAHLIKNKHCDKLCIFSHLLRLEIIKFLLLIQGIWIVFNVCNRFRLFFRRFDGRFFFLNCRLWLDDFFLRFFNRMSFIVPIFS